MSCLTAVHASATLLLRFPLVFWNAYSHLMICTSVVPEGFPLVVMRALAQRLVPRNLHLADAL
jgi:hypothetical protein